MFTITIHNLQTDRTYTVTADTRADAFDLAKALDNCIATVSRDNTVLGEWMNGVEHHATAPAPLGWDKIETSVEDTPPTVKVGDVW